MGDERVDTGKEHPARPRQYVLEVAELDVSREWTVGRVRILPKGNTRALIDAERRRQARTPNAYDKFLDEGVASRFEGSTIANVRCDDPREAYAHVADALAVLRLLQHVRTPMVDTDLQTFGLPGQAAWWRVDFIDLTAGPAQGFFRDGAFPGWTFGEVDYEAFTSDAGLQFLSAALVKDHRTRLEQRAILGARLLRARANRHVTELVKR